MPRRMSSPAPSDGGFDITDALFGDTEELTSQNEHRIPTVGDLEHINFLGEVSDDEAIIARTQSAANRKLANLKGRTVTKGGGFQAMGLNANLLKAITRKGYKAPTPIQRKTIPLLLKEKDVVGMARTGSGKTAAFVIPMIEKLKIHSVKVGARALIMSPSRELALQTLQVVKELGRGTDLRSILLVGGDSLEEQFSAMASNPDVIIATPGRFLHLMVEMSLELSSMRYVVFDEADRLFEMGFAAQLTEILHALPAARQTLLFSATLPKSLVEFARAGLRDPVLIRLDADSKISPNLQSAFFTVKSSEKEGALLHILQDVIKIPISATFGDVERLEGDETNLKKRKRDHEKDSRPRGRVSPFSTIVFAATKHHVEYLGQLLRRAGYAVSHIYGSLDQTARKDQVQAFRSGRTNILVVTDVAARGIDIPILANVINYDFPSQPKIFVHRVGRTARASEHGWSYSIIHDADAPYLLDLQLFLGRKLQVGRLDQAKVSFSQEVVLGSLQRDNMQVCGEWVNKTLDSDSDLALLRSVASKGEKLYQRTRNSASSESAKRARELIASEAWSELHPLFNAESNDLDAEREKMLAIVGGFRPQESVFEISARRTGRKGNEEAIEVMQKIRSGLERKKQKARKRTTFSEPDQTLIETFENDNGELQQLENFEVASDSDLEVDVVIPEASKRGKTKGPDLNAEEALQMFRNAENFMSYRPVNTNLDEDRAYGIQSGSNSNFTEAARGVTMDLGVDEAGKSFGEARGIMRWDKRQKKYVARQNDDDGSKGTRLVKGESGAKIAASFKSGRYDAWRKANRISRPPRVGETESAGVSGLSSKRYRHTSMKLPKAADKFRGDYDVHKKKVAAAKERSVADVGRRELRSVDDIRKQRGVKEKRREKNARPSKRKNR